MHFTVEAQKQACGFLSAGDIAVDATCGNGFDTLFLAERVGRDGVVYGVDIQPRAIEMVRKKLMDAGHLDRCRLVAGCHSGLITIVNPCHMGRVSVVMFNLGYLPYGDKTLVTLPSSTLLAMDQAFKVVRQGGLISVLAYPGHPGGFEEASCVEDWVKQRGDALKVERFQDADNKTSPILWVSTVR